MSSIWAAMRCTIAQAIHLAIIIWNNSHISIEKRSIDAQLRFTKRFNHHYYSEKKTDWNIWLLAILHYRYVNILTWEWAEQVNQPPVAVKHQINVCINFIDQIRYLAVIFICCCVFHMYFNYSFHKINLFEKQQFCLKINMNALKYTNIFDEIIRSTSEKETLCCGYFVVLFFAILLISLSSARYGMKLFDIFISSA